MEVGLGLGVFVGLCMLRLAHSRVGEECFPGDESLESVFVVLLVLRIVEGVCIVRFRIDDGFGLFGDRIDSGSARSMLVVNPVSVDSKSARV
jgi:hypothetical protein